MLSIIIPVYNRADLVSATLDSIRNQTYTDWECIVVDDHSTDDTVTVLEKYMMDDPRFQLLIRSDPIKGPSSCRNEGFRHSRGDFIYFFDSDDLLGNRFFETFLPQLEQNPELDYVNIRFARFRNSIEKCYRSSPQKPNRYSMLEALAARRVSHATVSFIWRRTLLEKQKMLWNPTMFRYEDREMAFRLVADARNGLHLPQPILCFYRKHGSELRTDSVSSEHFLAMIKTLLDSMTATCIQNNVTIKTEKQVARYVVRCMKLALRYRSRYYGVSFYLLKRKLHSSWITDLFAFWRVLRLHCLPVDQEMKK